MILPIFPKLHTRNRFKSKSVGTNLESIMEDHVPGYNITPICMEKINDDSD